MKQILFVKYNRTRKPEYQIKTEIIRENGNIYVLKKALTSEACKHISDLKKYAEKISDIYTGFNVDIPEISEDGSCARYRYIDGISEEDRIRGFLDNKEKLLPELRGYLDAVLAVKENKQIQFSMTQDFTNIFGDEFELDGKTAVEIANIDMIPENIIYSDGQMYCIDNEWVLEFPIPVEFLKYRILFYFYRKFRQDILGLTSEDEFWEYFDISEDSREIYTKMESKFQEYIHGKDNRYTDRYLKTASDFETLVNRSEQYEVQCKRIVELQDEVEERNTHISKLDSVIEERDKRIEERDKRIEELEGKEYELEVKTKLVEDKDVHIRNIEAELKNRETDILTLNHQINLKNNHIANIEYGYNKWIKFRNNPVFRAIRFPKWFAKKVYHRIKDGDGIERLIIPDTSNPKVSIIIPVYNQFDYTHACIKSIIDTVKDVPYEIIIGDDMSTDATKKIKKYVSGIRVNINKTDHGFLMNCNRAVKLARGEYIIFLNNDTQVHEEWLSSLVELIESDDKIGMVGSKLVYPDGSLQEAGGIIWSDASGWNYGRNQNADMPEYNYVRECDYISGASIMISKSLWDEIGGFDERFKPAYCEDSDLAFEVRKRGYKVMYQPKSVVTHFEGVSNGTELDSGLKKYQVENGKKFKEKWATELQSQYESGQVPFCARERNHGKKIILIIDHYVPTYDKDAGSKTTFQYIKMFLDKGYVVKFIGDNYAQMEPYTTTLQQLGVEVLYGPWYAEHIFEWIDANKEYISFAYLNRPHITEKYIDYIKENTDIKIIYYGHDLHFLRTEREYELEKDEKKLAESKMWKAKEFDILHKADMNYYPSYVEEEAIHQIDADIPVKAITAYVFEKFIENYNYDVANRSGILFVGGFAHGPNIDAVNWFANEVYPIIREKNKNIDFYIVGSNAPEEIKQLNGNGIIFKGFVSDEELMELYSKCRIVVVPLRYGAGVKGKVVEAIYNGAPIVTTSVGAEGIAGVEEVLKIEDEAEAFANTVVDLYSDEDALVELANKTQSFIKENFSIDAVWNIIKEDFE